MTEVAPETSAGESTAAPERTVKTIGCGACECAVSCDNVGKEPTHSQRLIIVAMALVCSTIALGCNTAVVGPLRGSAINIAAVDGQPNGWHWVWSNEDKVLIVAFCATFFLFMLALLVMKGAPACSGAIVAACTKPKGCLPGVDGSTHSNWRNTFALWSLVAFILHLSFVIEAADDQWQWNLNGNAAQKLFVAAEDNNTLALIITAIVFASFASALLGYLTVTFLVGKITAETNKNKFKDILCTAAGIITVLGLTMWLHFAERTNQNYLWFNSMMIGASCLAMVTVIEGIVFADEENVGGSRTFTLGAGLSSVLFFTFMVGAAVDMTMGHKSNPLVIVVLVLALANALLFCILACLSQYALSKQSMKTNNETVGQMFLRMKPNLLLGGILVFTIVQFSLAAGTGGFDSEAGATEPQIILSLGVGCVLAAVLFHTVLVDIVARGFHIALAALCYLVYFIYECFENTKWREEQLANGTLDANRKVFNTRVVALVFAAINVLFLILASVYFFFSMSNRKVDIEDAEEPPTDEE